MSPSFTLRSWPPRSHAYTEARLAPSTSITSFTLNSGSNKLGLVRASVLFPFHVASKLGSQKKLASLSSKPVQANGRNSGDSAGASARASGGWKSHCDNVALVRYRNSTPSVSFQPREQEIGVRINDLLRRVNFFHSAFESARVHTFWLLNRSADPALAANFLAQSEGAGQGPITRRSALRSIAKSISSSRREGVSPRGQMQLRGVLAGARADEKPTPAAERLGAGCQGDAVFALAFFAAPLVR